MAESIYITKIYITKIYIYITKIWTHSVCLYIVRVRTNHVVITWLYQLRNGAAKKDPLVYFKGW